MIAVDLKPRGPFHVGELGIGREETLPYVPSDTLYAALVVAWVVMGDAGPFDPPPLRVTSVFPRVGTLRLYPRPFLRFNIATERRDELGKTLTKLEWCSETIFGLLLQGADTTALAVKNNFVGGVWFHPDDLGRLPPPPRQEGKWTRFWETLPPVPHVAIDRVDNAPNLFHSGQVTFGPGCGLWFGAENSTSDASSRLERALAYLADAGLGGLRSTGHGGFTYQVNEAPIGERGPSKYGVTLSRYLPSSKAEIVEALKVERAAYKIVRVGGWCQDDAGHAWRRKQIRMVREGSVLGWNGKPLGRIADLKPDEVGRFGDRPVLRYGLAWMVPVSEEALL